MGRLSLCRECWKVMDNGAWPLCDACTEKRVTHAVATPLDIPVLWDDVPELPKYESEDDVPTVPTGTAPPLSALAPPKPWPASVSEMARKPKRLCPGCGGPGCEICNPSKPMVWKNVNRVPTMQERAAWFHHKQTTVAEQVGRGPKRPSLLNRLWLLMCRVAARTEMALLRLL